MGGGGQIRTKSSVLKIPSRGPGPCNSDLRGSSQIEESGNWIDQEKKRT